MNIRALQLGGNDFSHKYSLTADVQWNFEPSLSTSDREYDVALIDRTLTDEESYILTRIVRAYCLFILEGVDITPEMGYMMNSRCARIMPRNDLPDFINKELHNYFTSPYGEKFDVHQLVPSEGFHGRVYWHGYTESVFEGDFGKSMAQAAYWRGNIPVDKDQAIDLWLEYAKEGNLEIELQVVEFVSGSVSSISEIVTFSEDEMRDIVTIENHRQNVNVFISINARGKGTLKISGLHDRYSRRGKGIFLPGGQRIVTDSREEIFTYFDPGDLKPPLCVYFSGYKTMEGFEGYWLMRRMGCPFLLISEPRLEGGAFYMGNEEYESALKNVIQDTCNQLGFSNAQLIFSGLSMGTFGAFYYGSMLQPAYIIVGKPLLNLGNMAQSERIDRPGVFPTSLDVMWKQYRSLSKESINALNQRFWSIFDKANWSHTTFCVAYMIEDDYDRLAYKELLTHVNSNGAKVIGKGLHGRHNDNTSGIVSWFQRQYNNIIEDVFQRKK